MTNNLMNEVDFLAFDSRYKSLLKSNVSLIDKVIAYLCKKRGKFIRPALVVNVAKSLGSLDDKNYTVASLIEMIHLATLVHDDIVDEAYFRRGWPTIGRIWKNKISLLIGDYIFSRSLSAIIKLDDLESIKVLSNTSDRLSKGEIFQIQEARSGIISEENYYAMIKDKTASLFSAACELSARASSSNYLDFDNFRNFGENFGIAYQIKDDMNDILGTKSILGKPVILDVKRNTLTLPYIYCLDQLNKKEKKEFLYKIKRLSKTNKRKEIAKLVNDFKGLDYCKNEINRHIDLALRCIEKYPKKENFINLIETVFNEKK